MTGFGFVWLPLWGAVVFQLGWMGGRLTATHRGTVRWTGKLRDAHERLCLLEDGFAPEWVYRDYHSTEAAKRQDEIDLGRAFHTSLRTDESIKQAEKVGREVLKADLVCGVCDAHMCEYRYRCSQCGRDVCRACCTQDAGTGNAVCDFCLMA